MKAAKVRNICYYLRNSTDHQEYIFQREALDNYFNKFNDVNFIGEYAEKVSGFKSEKDRPLINQLLQDIDTQPITEIWCYDVARLSRDAINLQNIVKYCSDRKVNIYFLTNNIYTLNEDLTQNDTTKLIVSILANFAESDAKQLKTKMKYGKETKARTGTQYIGGVIPCGYTYVNDAANKTKNIIIDEDRKKVVEYIFEQYVNHNKSQNMIAKQLNVMRNNDFNFSTDSVYRNINSNVIHESWSATTIRSILKCSWYVGFKLYKKNEHINLPDELKFIDKYTWELAQVKMSTNKNKPKEIKHTHLLKDVATCGCGQQLTIKFVQRDDKKQNNYVCPTQLKNKFDKGVKCTHNFGSVKGEPFENAVWLLVKNKLDEFKIEVEKVTEKETDIQNRIDDINSFINSIENIEIKNLEQQKGRALDAFIKFGVNVDDKISVIENQISAQNKLIKEKKSEISKLQISSKNINVADEIEKNIKLIESDKLLIKSYINKLIDKIIVLDGLKNSRWNIVKIIWAANLNKENTFLLFNTNKNFSTKYYFISSTKNNTIEWNAENQNLAITENNETLNLSIENITKTLDCHYWEYAEQLYPWKMLNNFPLIREHKDLSTAEQFNTPIHPEAFGIDLNSDNYTEHQNYQQYSNLLAAVNSGTVDYKFKLNMGVGKLEIVTEFI